MTDPRFTDPRYSDPRFEYPRLGDERLGSQSAGVGALIVGLFLLGLIAIVIIADRHNQSNNTASKFAPSVNHSSTRMGPPSSTTGSGSKLPRPLMPLPTYPGTK
jgi:hypothetical protein